MKLYSLVLVLLLAGCEEGMLTDTALLETFDFEDQERGQRGVRATPAVAAPMGFASELPVLTVTYDNGGDGEIDRVMETTFNEDGQRIFMREDRDGDGEFELLTGYDYVWDQGKLIRIETDEDADGSVDIVETREYTANGRIWRNVRDEGDDGSPDRVEESLWDVNGHRVRMSIDSPAGGVIETVQEYAYGADNIVDGRKMSRYNDNGLIQSTRYENGYLPNGRLGSISIDLQDDGQVDNVMERIYDMDGRMIGTLTDNGADGSMDSLHSYIYSIEGRLVEIAIDMGNDGDFENIIYRDYQNFKPMNVNGGCP